MKKSLSVWVTFAIFFGTLPYHQSLAASTGSQSRAPEAFAAFDCKQLIPGSPGCPSFNEMLSSEDKDILRRLTGDYEAYVCFRPGEDVFTVVNFVKFNEKALVKAEKGPMLEQVGTAEFVRYSNGVEDDNGLTFGKWTNWPKATADLASFSSSDLDRSSPDSSARIDVNSSEVLLTYKWKNLVSTTTSYTLQIRRSTRRFVETLEFPEPKTDTKSAAPPKPLERFTHSGYCAEYNN